MRRSLVPVAAVAAVAASLALTTPALAGTHPANSHHSTGHSTGHTTKLVLKKALEVIPANDEGQRIVALPGKHAQGQVRFVLKGVGLKQARRIEVTAGKATFEVPPLSAGTYRITATFDDLKGKISFRVSAS